MVWAALFVYPESLAQLLIVKEMAVRVDSHLKSLLCVVPPGIEPGTPGFSVLCSTN